MSLSPFRSVTLLGECTSRTKHPGGSTHPGMSPDYLQDTNNKKVRIKLILKLFPMQRWNQHFIELTHGHRVFSYNCSHSPSLSCGLIRMPLPTMNCVSIAYVLLSFGNSKKRGLTTVAEGGLALSTLRWAL